MRSAAQAAVNRREFSAALAGAAASAALAPSAQAAAAEAPAISQRAKTLYRHALILDCNSSPPSQERLPLPQAALERVRDSGINVIKLTVGGINSDFADTVAEIAQVQQLCEVHPAYFTQVRIAGRPRARPAERRLGIILSFESAEMLGGRLDSFELFRNLGVRVMQLSYNRKSAFAGSHGAGRRGLTSLGRDAVRRMNQLGIAVDLSHANPQTTADTLGLSARPPIMTHAGCSAVHVHPRNKTDEQLRALAARGAWWASSTCRISRLRRGSRPSMTTWRTWNMRSRSRARIT